MRGTWCLPLLALAACAHPEDRRWAELSTPLPSDTNWKPTVSVYSVATPDDPKPPLKLKDLAGDGQAAYIDRLADAKDPKAMRLELAAPIGPSGGISATTKPSLDRTMIISVQKPIDAGVADRIMKTVITITPFEKMFEFSGYTIVATDNQVQNIAHLETTTDASLEATLAPTIKGTGDNGIVAKTGKSQTTAADIGSQYEKLNVDIQPGRIVITRESERGTDVVGNTIIKLTIIPKLPAAAAGMPAGSTLFLVNDQTLIAKGAVLSGPDASLDIEDYAIPKMCEIRANVSMDYLVRKVTKGSEFYTEGKQTAVVVKDNVAPGTPALIVPAEEVVPPLWQIVVGSAGQQGLIAKVPGVGGHIIVFNNYNAALTFAYWLRKTGATAIGSDGVVLFAGGVPLKGATINVKPYGNKCL